MATRQTALNVCDGCARDTFRNQIEIVQSERRRPGLDGDHGTLDLCADCAGRELYICRLCQSVHDDEHPCQRQREMLTALQRADERTSFYLRAHIGNYSLFLSGVFPDRIRFRAEVRGGPDVKYYDALGRTHFRAAGDHRLAQRYELAPIFNTLSERFETTRRALNDIAGRLFVIGDANIWLEPMFNVRRGETGS